MKLELLLLVLTISALQIAGQNNGETESDESNESDGSGENTDAKTVEIYAHCIQKYNITLKEKPETQSHKAMCIRMCGMKANGMIMENGQFNKEIILKEISKTKPPQDIKKIEEVLDICIPEALNEKDECNKPERLINCAESKSEELIKQYQ